MENFKTKSIESLTNSSITEACKRLGKYFIDQAQEAGAERLAQKILIEQYKKEKGKYSSLPNQLSEKETKEIEYLVKNGDLWSRIRSQFKDTDRRGVMFIGPSGAGKTSVQSALIHGVVESLLPSTQGVQKRTIRLGSKMTKGCDTPGRIYHNGGKAIAERLLTHTPIIGETPRILCLVFADGYLHSEGEDNFERIIEGGDKGTEKKIFNDNKDEFINHTRDEEIRWVEYILEGINLLNKKPDKLINEVIIVVNKRELWDHRYDEVENRYTNNPYLQELAHKLTNKRDINFFGVSAKYDSFRGGIWKSKAKWSVNHSEVSILLLRAQITRLLEQFS